MEIRDDHRHTHTERHTDAQTGIVSPEMTENKNLAMLLCKSKYIIRFTYHLRAYASYAIVFSKTLIKGFRSRQVNANVNVLFL